MLICRGHSFRQRVQLWETPHTNYRCVVCFLLGVLTNPATPAKETVSRLRDQAQVYDPSQQDQDPLVKEGSYRRVSQQPNTHANSRGKRGRKKGRKRREGKERGKRRGKKRWERGKRKRGEGTKFFSIILSTIYNR